MDNKQSPLKCCETDYEQTFDQNYWETRWQKNETAWDIGHPSPAIKEYLDQYPDKNVAILIPGCGNAYEAEYMIEQGFTNITLIDISPEAVERVKLKFKEKKEVEILCVDFFTHQGKYDLIIEQTFFCAIPPARRTEYFKHSSELLNENGKITGVLFDKEFNQPFPPFGGNADVYKKLLAPYFTVKKMEKCYNSILPRANSEIFINLIKK